MRISQNVSLREHNSFGFDINAEYFCRAETIDEIHEALQWRQQHNKPLLVLGGGSNTVFTRNVEGLVLQIALDQIDTTVDSDAIRINAGAGVNWHQLVKQTVFNAQYGLENLALIPGNAGAAPIQNIGAYGKELCDNLVRVDALHRETRERISLSNAECDFGYRHSLFKTKAGSEFIVLGIELSLSHLDEPLISYHGLQEEMKDTSPTAREVFNKVCQLRQSKLPDPTVIGNAGSFFKNPIVPRQQVDELLKQYPNMPVYPYSDSESKLPAAWLIDQAGWKGRRSGNVGVHDKQALVLVNHGGGNGQQIAILASEIQLDIKQRYQIALEREPTMY